MLKTQPAPKNGLDAVQIFKLYLSDMLREGRFAYIDESNNRVFRQKDGQLVEATAMNESSFPEAAIWISVPVAAMAERARAMSCQIMAFDVPVRIQTQRELPF